MFIKFLYWFIRPSTTIPQVNIISDYIITAYIIIDYKEKFSLTIHIKVFEHFFIKNAFFQPILEQFF